MKNTDQPTTKPARRVIVTIELTTTLTQVQLLEHFKRATLAEKLPLARVEQMQANTIRDR